MIIVLQFNLGTDFIEHTLIIAFAGIVLTLSLAFGLGARESTSIICKDLLDKHYDSNKKVKKIDNK